MALEEAFIAYLAERLEPLGKITSKRMFGGCGIFCDGQMICKISPSSTVSLKADKESAQTFQKAGMRKSGKMNYYELSPEQLEDEEMFLSLAGLALKSAKGR